VVRRARAKLVDAALRCDLPALAALSERGSLTTRFHATSALFHHGGFHRPTPSACTCGQCEKDEWEKELDLTKRVTRLAWEGRADEALSLAWDTPALVPGVMGQAMTEIRIVNRFIVLKLDPESSRKVKLPSEWFDQVLSMADQGMPWVRWPMRLAAAIEAVRRDDEAAARKLTEGMPSWPEGSPLEDARRELALRLVAHPAA
jgi:hypothetical protein